MIIEILGLVALLTYLLYGLSKLVRDNGDDDKSDGERIVSGWVKTFFWPFIPAVRRIRIRYF